MTKHCELRVKERMNLCGAGAEKLVSNALILGMIADNLPAKEKEYMKRKEVNGIVTRYYNGCCFIFGKKEQCITMYHAPEWFMQKSKYDGKKHIRNPKKYFIRYCDQQYLN